MQEVALAPDEATARKVAAKEQKAAESAQSWKMAAKLRDAGRLPKQEYYLTVI